MPAKGGLGGDICPFFSQYECIGAFYDQDVTIYGIKCIFEFMSPLHNFHQIRFTQFPSYAAHNQGMDIKKAGDGWGKHVEHEGGGWVLIHLPPPFPPLSPIPLLLTLPYPVCVHTKTCEPKSTLCKYPTGSIILSCSCQEISHSMNRVPSFIFIFKFYQFIFVWVICDW